MTTCCCKSTTAILGLTVLVGFTTACSTLDGQAPYALVQPKEEITVGIYDRGRIDPEEGTLENNRWTRWINDNGPVKVKFISIPRGSSVQKYKVLFASNNAPDLILDYETSFLSELITSQQVIPIDELVEQYSPNYSALLNRYPLVRKLATEADGKMYRIAQITGLKTNHVLVIRNDWLRKLDLQVPETADELFEVAKAFTELDPDGNGVHDTYGINFTGLGPLLNTQIAGGIRPLDMMFRNVGYLQEEGHLRRDWERTYAALEYAKKLFESGVIDRNFMTDKSGEKAKLDFVNGKLGVYWASSGIEELYPMMQHMIKNNPQMELQAIPLPAIPYGRFNPLAKAPAQLVGAINKQSKNPQAVMKYIDFMLSEKALTTLRFGFEGEHHKKKPDGCYQYIDNQKYNRELSYTSDLYMISSRIILGKCNSLASSLDINNELDKQYIRLEEEAERLSLNPLYDFAYAIGDWPTLPGDLKMSLNEGLHVLTNIYYKAITDPSYAVTTAVEDAKHSWEQTGGLKVDRYYDGWIQQNQDRVFYTNRYYDIN